MEKLRLLSSSDLKVEVPCCLCQAPGFPWDQIERRAICNDCQEHLIAGRVTSWQIMGARRPCLLCDARPTLSWLTIPLCDPDPIEIDLCSPHLHALLGRRLSTRAYRKIRRELNRGGFAVEQFFLLHEGFYDEEGKALQPLSDY